jgi:hypothetical protein
VPPSRTIAAKLAAGFSATQFSRKFAKGLRLIQRITLHD